MEWTTKITELLGCKYPILEGGLSGLGTWELAAAVTNAGAEGCITAGVYRTPDSFREAIRKMRDAVGDKPFTVNFTYGMNKYADEKFRVCVEENIDHIETAVYKPDDIVDRIKEAGMTWIHKAATLRHLKHAEKLGADALVLVGLDGWGFKHPLQLPTFTSIAWAANELSVPLIAAGGIGDARTLLGALGLGAEGVYMGTAFEVCKESRLPEKVKQNIVSAIPNHPDLIYELLAPIDQEEYNKLLSAKNEMPFEKWIPALEALGLKHSPNVPEMWVMAEPKGDEMDAHFIGPRLKGPYSFACAYIDHLPTAKELIEGIVHKAEEIVDTWQFIKR